MRRGGGWERVELGPVEKWVGRGSRGSEEGWRGKPSRENSPGEGSQYLDKGGDKKLIDGGSQSLDIERLRYQDRESGEVSS